MTSWNTPRTNQTTIGITITLVPNGATSKNMIWITSTARLLGVGQTKDMPGSSTNCERKIHTYWPNALTKMRHHVSMAWQVGDLVAMKIITWTSKKVVIVGVG